MMAIGEEIMAGDVLLTRDGREGVVVRAERERVLVSGVGWVEAREVASTTRPPGAVVPTVMMDAADARGCCEQIRKYMRAAGDQLAELHDREGWRALGYASWRECVVAEFGQSAAYLYRLLAAQRIRAELESPMGENESPIGEIPERVLRSLNSLPAGTGARREAWDLATEAAGGERPTAREVGEPVPPMEYEPEPEELAASARRARVAARMAQDFPDD